MSHDDNLSDFISDRYLSNPGRDFKATLLIAVVIGVGLSIILALDVLIVPIFWDAYHGRLAATAGIVYCCALIYFLVRRSKLALILSIAAFAGAVMIRPFGDAEADLFIYTWILWNIIDTLSIFRTLDGKNPSIDGLLENRTAQPAKGEPPSA